MTLSILLICMLNLLSQSSSYGIGINMNRSTTTSTAKSPNAVIFGMCISSEHEEGDFHYNLKNHLSISLLSNIDSSGVYNGDYLGTNSSCEETVYVISLCRRDLSLDLCNDCVNSAATLALQTCPTGYRLLYWYDHCVYYRYSNENRTFFGTANSRSEWTSDILHPITKPSRFDRVLATTLNELVAKASRGDKRFATKEAKVRGTNSTLYSLGQCVGGMSPADCKLCLSKAVHDIVLQGSQLDGRFQYPRCNIRYQLFPFYEAKLSYIEIVVLSEILALALVCLVLVAWGYYCFVQRRKIDEGEENVAGIQMNTEALQFDLITIQMATSMFSQDNKLGRGGFGEVFKGKLSNGQDIAVKRRSKSSGQGAHELKNEVELVGKLQHRNLVRLLGFCLEEEECLLVYEYVPNKSLDHFLFDAKQREKLNWPTRRMIIRGIARGILYLQEDSRLRVIHRDLKAANILLDSYMNPMISDFGMAKRLGADDQTSGNTTRVVGTHGYMAPEYVMKGLYSTKSDVFSFGVLLLEILTGKRNFLGFQLADSAHTLGEHAWQMWNEDNGLELMDPLLKDSCSSIEFLRCIHVGLLCVQEEANKRPTMSSVVQMLTAESSTTSLSKPDRPAFFTGRSTAHLDQIAALNCSATELTISDFCPR